MELKNIIMATGLSALALGTYACDVPKYTGAGLYSCEKYGDRISAKNLTMLATKEKLGLTDEIQITYSKNMSTEQAVKAIEGCEKAFKLKAEMEEQ